ncbi:MAG: glycosyltransferase family 4 protein [Fretibacterium sp.]|nr:glycosyltransferase family 4 protein [Fretibacterium sp.]
MRRKVNVDLRDVNLPDMGMSVYANEMTLRLMNYSDLEIRGTVLKRGLLHSLHNPEDYARFDFPVYTTRFPAWVVMNPPLPLAYRLTRALLRFFIFSYNSLVGDDESDIFLFFMNQASDFPIKGKTIVCVHDIIPLRMPWACAEEVIRNCESAFPHVLEKSTKIITDSEFSKQDIIDYAHIDESRIDVIHCGVDAEMFSVPCPDMENVRIKYGLPGKYILYFGSCRPYKNVESVISAYARLPEAVRKEYALVITNPNDVVRDYAVKRNIIPHYIENVSAKDKAAVYQMASVFVWPSLYEGFGLPVIEAQAAGTPVVCSNVTSLPEVAGDAAVLVAPKDTKSIAAAIEHCLYDEPFQQDLIAKGHKNVKRFTWDNAAKKLHDIIINL